MGKEIASKLVAGSTVSFNAVLNREGKPNAAQRQSEGCVLSETTKAQLVQEVCSSIHMLVLL